MKTLIFLIGDAGFFVGLFAAIGTPEISLPRVILIGIIMGLRDAYHSYLKPE